MWLLYQIAFGAALLVAAPVLLLRKGRHYSATLRGRLGAGEAPPGARGGLWLHAVSVGEVGVAAALARALPADQPLVVTTITPTGQARARAAFAARGGRAAVRYLPFDLGFAVRRFLDPLAPRALVLVEGDLWPLVLRAASRRGLPIAVVNGRVSDRGFARMRRLRRLLGPLLGRVDRFGMQTAADRERLLALGVAPERVAVTGNLKYESPDPPLDPALADAVRRTAAGRPLLLAGSTMAGEEEAVLAAFRALGGGQRALLVLAPRHPERLSGVEARLASEGWDFRRRSALGTAGASDPPVAVLLLDTMGELAGLYRLAAAAFVGGTLVPTGGHNPLEPARFGVPVAVGPSMHNFREMAEAFDRRGAWARVADAAALARTWGSWLDDPAAARAVGERGAALIAEQRGALERTLAFLRPVLEAAAP